MRESKNISQKKSIFSFVVEGKCELWYLQRLKQHERLSVNLEPRLPQKKTLQKQYELVEKLAEEESEKVFWIVDFDTIMKETREVKKGNKTLLQEFQELYDKCKNNDKIIVVVNNPCFEYWFLQHFEQTSKHFTAYAELEKNLKKYLIDYEKTEKYYKNSRQDIYQKLKENQQIAIFNSEKLGEFSFENSTTGIAEMYKIFKELNIDK